MEIIINDIEYVLKENHREGFDYEVVKEKATDYFNDYDYIFGDWAYNKLRLKGFYAETNKNVKKINNINTLEQYIKNNCAYGCRYFLLAKKDIGKNK